MYTITINGKEFTGIETRGDIYVKLIDFGLGHDRSEYIQRLAFASFEFHGVKRLDFVINKETRETVIKII